MPNKTKVGTVLDRDVVRRAKILAVTERRPLSSVIEEALRAYVGARGGKAASVVLNTQGIVKARLRHVREALRADPFES